MNNLHYLVYCENKNGKELSAAFADKRNANVYAEELNKRAEGRYRCYVESKRKADAKKILEYINNVSLKEGENIEEMMLRAIEEGLEQIAPEQKREIKIKLDAKAIGKIRF